ncbi:ribosomal protein L7/L12 [Mycobacterium seoulense]|uniref:ribosomal protein L7/L12 n=1 Tax=Mycobacterium seoulense TaxID=386911 RepID=UPI003CE74EB0
MEDPHIYRRLALLEQQVRLLSERLEVPCPTFGSDVGATAPGVFENGVPAEVVGLARSGNKIAAIKLYQQLTGAGLREAKDAVDSL